MGKNECGNPGAGPDRIRGRAWFGAGRARSRRFFSEEGSALVEFAVVLPLLITLLSGSASFSLALYSFQQLGNTTATATQLVAAEQGLITDPCAAAVTSVTSTLPNWAASKMTYTLALTDANGAAHTFGPTTGNSFSCTSGAADMAANEPITLTVSYQYTWFPILDFSPSSNLTVTQSALME